MFELHELVLPRQCMADSGSSPSCRNQNHSEANCRLQRRLSPLFLVWKIPCKNHYWRTLSEKHGHLKWSSHRLTYEYTHILDRKFVFDPHIMNPAPGNPLDFADTEPRDGQGVMAAPPGISCPCPVLSAAFLPSMDLLLVTKGNITRHKETSAGKLVPMGSSKERHGQDTDGAWWDGSTT